MVERMKVGLEISFCGSGPGNHCGQFEDRSGDRSILATIYLRGKLIPSFEPEHLPNAC
jgi:hypothetical protein